MANTETLEQSTDTSWVTPMGKRARMLIDAYNSGDADKKADAAEKIVLVGEQIELMQQTGQPLTEAQQALMEIYEEIKALDPQV